MTAENTRLDLIFKSLADTTRRDILSRIVDRQLTITEIAEPYDLSYAAISKHLKVLEKAGLISRKRDGKSFLIQTRVETLREVDEFITFYRRFWSQSLDKLESYLEDTQDSRSPQEKEDE